MELHKNAGGLRANERMVSSIEEIEEYKRVGIHYLRWQPTPILALGFAEAFVTSGPFPGDLFYHTVPFLPYYASKYLPGLSGGVDNCLVYGDGELALPLVTLYGELALNEFPMTPKERGPKLFAITLGAETDKLLPHWNVTGEFSYVSDQAYSNGNIDSVYSRGDRSLGHPVGDDVKTVELQLKRDWERIDTETRFGAYLQELGNTEVKPWRNVAEDKVPEKVVGVKLGVSHVRNQTGLEFDLDVGYADNFEHKLGATGFKYVAVAKVTWYLY